MPITRRGKRYSSTSSPNNGRRTTIANAVVTRQGGSVRNEWSQSVPGCNADGDDSSMSTASELEESNQDGVPERVSEQTEMEKRLQFRNQIMTVYDEMIGLEKCVNVERDVKCAVRDYLIPKVKFVDVGNKRGFPSFLCHDFTDTKHFITKFVDDRLDYRKESMQYKAAFWITYGKIVKKEFSNHRSACTSTIKKAFLKGKYNMINVVKAFTNKQFM